MSERIDEWPRVHTCVHDWCPHKTDDCKHCDELVELIRNSRPIQQKICGAIDFDPEMLKRDGLLDTPAVTSKEG